MTCSKKEEIADDDLIFQLSRSLDDMKKVNIRKSWKTF